MKKLLLSLVLAASTVTIAQADFSPDSLRGVIAENNQAFSRGFAQKSAATIAANYTETATLLEPGAGFREGRQAILEYWESTMPFIQDMKLEIRSLEGTRELLYETGVVDTWIRTETGVVIQHDKYVNVWVRQLDGRYQIDIDMWNGRPTPKSPE